MKFKTALIVLVFVIHFYHSHAQSPIIDSLKIELKKTQHDTSKVKILNELARLLGNTNVETARNFSNEAYQIASKENYLKGKAEATHRLGTLLYYQGENLAAIDSLKKAIGYWTSIRNRKGLEGSYNNLGAVYRVLGKFDTAIYYYRQSLKLCIDQSCTARNAMNIGIANQDLGNFEAAIESFIMAEKSFIEINEMRGLAIVYLNLGSLYTILKNRDKAKEAFLQAEVTSRGIKHMHVLSRSLINLGVLEMDDREYDTAFAYLKEAKQIQKIIKDNAGMAATNRDLGNILLQIQKPKEATLYLDSAIEGYSKVGMKQGLVQAYRFRAMALNKQYQLNDAIEAAKTSLEISQEIKDPNEAMETLKLLSQLYEESKQPSLALKTYKEFSVIKDSLFNITKANQIADLETKYETEKKDQEIASLTQQKIIQDLKLSQRNNQLLIGGLFFLIVIIGGLLYYRQDKIKKEQAVAELQQRFLRSQLNPHFIFNSMTSIQHYLMEKDPESASHYMGLFSTLMRQILENSREAYITLKEEVSTLTNYLELQKARFKNQFEYEIIVDESLDEDYAGIPPMFAQPFIENSLEHGLFKKEGENKIRIHFRKSGEDMISLTIEDSGIGMDQAIKKTEHKSLARQITKERMDLLQKHFKSKARFVSENILENGSTKGLRVNLVLPSKLLAA